MNANAPLHSFPVMIWFICISVLCKRLIGLTFSQFVLYSVYHTPLTHTFIFYCSDPPDVSIDNADTPAVEYTTRCLSCMISGGNLSDLQINDYQWMYRPTYRTSDKYIPPPNGMCLTNLLLTLVSSL